MELQNMRVAEGGLMRCCTGTIWEMFDEKPDQKLSEGQRINCRYEKKPTMKVEGGTIKWIGFEEASAQQQKQSDGEPSS